MTNPVELQKVKAVQEPGNANVWAIQDATGSAVARMTVNSDAEAWAKRIETALNAQCLPAVEKAARVVTLPSSITVTKEGAQVFKADAGRMGQHDSACRDFICFASPIIGASYYYLSYVDAAKRITNFGFETTIVEDGQETVVRHVLNSGVA